MAVRNLGLGYSMKMIDWKSCGNLLHLVEVMDVCIWFSDMAFQQISQQQQLQAFWVNQKQEIETVADFNNNSLPYARIEKIDDSGQRKS
ncbi:hypothetical protein QQ045_005865 [Rhodiola kirilowii]